MDDRACRRRAGEPVRDERARPFQADLRKYYRICFQTELPSRRQKLRLWLTHYGLHCVAAYRFHRFARALAQQSPVLGTIPAALAGALGHAVELVHHVRIYADVGPGFFIGHVGTIYVGPTTIGRNFSITHNVTVGYGHTDNAKGTPVIGDDVWVGTGSVLSGSIHIDNGVTVANGTMLARNVPAQCLVAGNPGRVVMQDYDNALLLGKPPPVKAPAAVQTASPGAEAARVAIAS